METANPLTSKKRTAFYFWLAWLAITVLYVLLRINAVNIPLDRDEGIFGYSGQVILDGGLPYRDVFEHKPPLVFYLNALALLIVPASAAGIHTFLHVYNFLTLITLFLASATYTKSATAGFWVAFVYAVFSSIPTIQGFTASTEMFLLFPLALSLLFAVLASRNKRLYFLAISGACSALAFFTKPSAAMMIFFIFSYLTLAHVDMLRKQQITHRNIAIAVLIWGGGFIGVSLCITSYFYYHDILNDFFYWSFIHSYLYAKGYTLSLTSPEIYSAVIEIVQGNFPLMIVALLGNLVVVFKKNVKGYFTLGFLLFSFLATIPGASFRHYFAQLAPAVSIAGGLGFFFIANRVRETTFRIVASVVFGVAVIAAPVLVHSGYYITKTSDQFSRDFFGYDPFPESEDLAKYLSERTTIEDTIFILGSEAQILVLSQRKSATSFALIYPLFSSFPRYMEFQHKVWEEVLTNMPKYIITVNPRNLSSFLWDGKADLWIWRKCTELLRTKYSLEAVVTKEVPKGSLLFVSEIKKLRNKDKGSSILMYVFKKRVRT
jgi:hypothetical protein